MTLENKAGKEIVEALLANLESSVMYIGPLLMSLAIVLGILSSITPGNVNTVFVPIAVSMGVIGGYFEFHSLIVMMRVKDVVTGREPSLLVYVGKASLLTGLYYTVIGSLLTASVFREVAEYVLEEPIQNLLCWKYYNYLFIIVSLGAALTPLQACISRVTRDSLSARHVIPNEFPESFSPHTDNWQ